MSDWYYQDSRGQQMGPVDEKTLEDLVNSGTVTNETLVRQSMSDWKPFGTVGVSALKSTQSSNPYSSPTAQTVVSQSAPHGGSKPPTYMVNSVLVTLLCCLPLGIVAIVHSSRVTSLYDAGAYENALRESREAKKWGNYALFSGIVINLLFIGGGFISGMSGQ